jgi:hypothetical protein
VFVVKFDEGGDRRKRKGVVFGESGECERGMFRVFDDSA